MSSRHNMRLARLERVWNVDHGYLRNVTVPMKGCTVGQILDELILVLSADTLAVVRSIKVHLVAHLARYDALEIHSLHIFNVWLIGLTKGSWALPASLTAEYLAGFDVVAGGCINRRCERCYSALPDTIAYERCPICGSRELSFKDTSGIPTPPPTMYTPLRSKSSGVSD